MGDCTAWLVRCIKWRCGMGGWYGVGCGATQTELGSGPVWHVWHVCPVCDAWHALWHVCPVCDAAGTAAQHVYLLNWLGVCK